MLIWLSFFKTRLASPDQPEMWSVKTKHSRRGWVMCINYCSFLISCESWANQVMCNWTASPPKQTQMLQLHSITICKQHSELCVCNSNLLAADPNLRMQSRMSINGFCHYRDLEKYNCLQCWLNSDKDMAQKKISSLNYLRCRFLGTQSQEKFPHLHTLFVPLFII